MLQTAYNVEKFLPYIKRFNVDTGDKTLARL